MKKYFKFFLPALLVAAAAGAVSAQHDEKAVNMTGSSSAEQTASQARRNFTPPRAKRGSAPQLSKVYANDRNVPFMIPGPRRAESGYIEYVPDIKGMDFGSTTTTLNTIGLDGSLTPVSSVSLSSGLGTPGGGYGVDKTYYVTIQYAYPGLNIFYVFAYDTETWQMVEGWPHQISQRFMSTDLTYDATDDKVYGCFTNDAADGYEFGTADFAEGERTTISSLPAAWNAIAADKQGNLYAIDMEGTLLKVDKSNGSTTEVGPTGFVPQNVSSATFDNKTDKLYWTVSTDSEGFLCEVDTQTGAATKLATFPNGEEIYALRVMPPAAEDRAPAAPTNLRLNFTDASLSGNLVFDAPATLFRGEEGTGTMRYRVLNGGATVASGTTTYGATEVSSPVFEVDAPGRYKFTLVCTNDEGDSPAAEIEQFIGADAPAGVTDARAVYSEGVFTVTWTAPDASANGGYINPSDVTYTVTRLPDNVTVIENTKSTTVTDAVAEPESFVKYKYSVQAEYDGWKSVAVNTNGVGLGNILPPFTEDFSDTNFLESYTTIDSNGDGRGWAPFIGMAQGLGPLYGSENSTADDWLLTPAVKLEGGKFYKFGISAATMGTTWTESFEVAIGNNPEVDSMTQIVLPTQQVCTSGFMSTQPFEEYFSVAEDGVYYIGLHYNTPSDTYMILLDNLYISEPIDAMSPDAVSGLTVTPWPDGEKKATVAFTAPATDLQGEPLPFLDRVEVLIDGSPLHTFTGINPGQEVTADIDIPTSGLHKFTVTAWNGDTEGRSSEVEVHVGLNVPVAPESVTAVAATEPGMVTVSWSGVSTDIDGKTIPEDEITYLVVRLVNGQQSVVASEIKETTITYSALSGPDEDQEFFQYAVFAHAEAGYSSGSVSAMIPVGRPDALPWVESFADGGLEHIMAAHPLDGTAGAWQNFGDQSFSMGVKSYDADNGMIGMNGPSIGDKARLFTGMIDFTGLEHPTLSFYTFNLQSADSGILDTNEITIQADCGDGLGFRPVETLVVNDLAGGVRGWTKAVVDLTAYAGKKVQLAFDAETKSYLYTLIDLVEIKDRKDIDLALLSTVAPKVSDLDSQFEVSVSVENTGRQPVEAYTVTLYNNGRKVASLDGEMIATGNTVKHTFPVTLNASDNDTNILHAELECATDMNPDNNRGEDITVRLRHTDFPGVRSLTAKRIDSNTVELAWEAPEQMSDADVRVTEDFEEADTETVFPTEYGNWTFVDADGGYIGGMRGVELPGIQTGSQQSFWVMDAAHPVFNGNTSYAANSGTKYLAQMYTMNLQSTGAVPCDDWIISPMLNEKAQTVEFYAKSYGNEDTNERFQFLYSATGTDISDFVNVETVSAVPHSWTKFSFEVPAGARYFAIRCTSIFEFMLFIDDITYTPANGSNLVLSGYNVYVDGVKANSEPLTSTSWTDVTASAKSDATRYSVSALYSHGESRTAHVSLDNSGVGLSHSDTCISGGKGHIDIKGENLDVTVWTLDGIRIYAGFVNGSESIAAAPGVYLVRHSNCTTKVVVR